MGKNLASSVWRTNRKPDTRLQNDQWAKYVPLRVDFTIMPQLSLLFLEKFELKVFLNFLNWVPLSYELKCGAQEGFFQSGLRFCYMSVLTQISLRKLFLLKTEDCVRGDKR